MASLIQFGFRTDEALTIAEDAISYATTATNNLIYETGLNSPYRILVEAQIYVYDQFVILLKNLEQELRLIFFELLGFSALAARQARGTLKFELLQTRIENTYFSKGFPVRATNGKLFLTERTLLIPAGSKLGYVDAIAAEPGSDGNLPPYNINQALKVIDTEFTVTNESSSSGGTNGEKIVDLQARVGAFIRGSSLVTKLDVYNYIKQTYPRLTLTVDNDEDLIDVDIYACYINGDTLTPSDFTIINNDIRQRMPLGIRSVELHRMDVITLFLHVIVSINRASVATQIANDINYRLRQYLYPGNFVQTVGATRGIVVNNELTRIANGLYIDYVQSVSVGLNEESVYANNFVFNPINQRVRVGTIKVTMIQGDFVDNRTFTQ